MFCNRVEVLRVLQEGMVLGVFAKQPLVGTAKTRLAEATSPPWALRVAEAFPADKYPKLHMLSMNCEMRDEFVASRPSAAEIKS